MALLRCNEAQAALIVAFRSSALLGLVSLILLDNTPYILNGVWFPWQPTLPRVPKAGSMTMVLLCLIGQRH